MPGSYLTTVVETKSGVVANTSFSGNPKKATVAFASLGLTNFGDDDYAIIITGSDKRSWSWESKTASGFVINAGANQPLTGSVTWMASKNGER